MHNHSLTHLKGLEVASIHIIRKVVAECDQPVMLYSVGNDSSVMVRLAQKAFHSSKMPASTLGANDIGCVMLMSTNPFFFDPYSKSRSNGSPATDSAKTWA